MTNEETLSMQPGNELNIKVAETIMGNIIADDATFGCMERFTDPTDGSSTWDPITPYSEDISSAGLVVDRMIELGYQDAIYWAEFGKGKYTEAEAICKAALLAIAEAPVASCEKS